MTPDEAREVASALGFVPDQAPTRLSGGNLNWVFRVRAEDASAILKVAPPHVATNPAIPLDPARSRQEGRGLRRAAEVLGRRRVPEVWATDDERHALLLEDLDPHGSGCDLATHLATGDSTLATEWLREVGQEVGRLHRQTWGRDDEQLANPAVQRARHRVQYQQVPGWLAGRGLPAALGEPVVALGKWLCTEPGRCLVMGDLWPASVWVRADGSWALIDWELCHYGQPLQDVAHLRAHLWLAARDEATWDRWSGALAEGYASTGPGWRAEQRSGALLHEAAELLARTVGAFPLFERTDPRVDRAVARAVGLLGG